MDHLNILSSCTLALLDTVMHDIVFAYFKKDLNEIAVSPHTHIRDELNDNFTTFWGSLRMETLTSIAHEKNQVTSLSFEKLQY